jgi:hypothetical protein
MHHGETRREDMKLIISRVIGENLTLPSFDELQGNDVSYASYTNSDRNVISNIIFSTILEKRHPKEHKTFEIPEQTINIKGNFSHCKTNELKSSSYHKLVQSQCGDDNVQSRNGQNIIRVDPCLKFFVGCHIMFSVNDFKKNGVVKGTTRIFKGVILKENRNKRVKSGMDIKCIQLRHVVLIK